MFLIAACMVGVMLFPPPPNKPADYCEPTDAVKVDLGDLYLHIPLELKPSVQIGDKPRYYGTTESCIKQSGNYCCKIISSPIHSAEVNFRVQYGERADYDYTNVSLKVVPLSLDKLRFMPRSPGDQEGPLLLGNPTLITSTSRVFGSWNGLSITFGIDDVYRINGKRDEYIYKVYASVEKTLLSIQSQAPR
jgi:hypothetical protein